VVAFNWTHAGPGRKMPGLANIIEENMGNLLFNYPIVGGFAVIIKMMKNSWLKKQETIQVAREKANAELQLLKSQIHPHFLFNTLNNIYFFTLTASQKAPEILTKLTDLLRYIINECNQQLVPLTKELKMIEDYMGLERIRYGDHLKMEIDIRGYEADKKIPPLLLIPLVENSFKHGASKMLEHPWVNLSISIEGQWLFFLLSNSRPDVIDLSQHPVHIGLNNVKKRLQLLYPDAHELDIAETSRSFEVFMKIRLEDALLVEKNITPENIEYAMA
jgi:LytS/YehU family sensor histidine kinase